MLNEEEVGGAEVGELSSRQFCKTFRLKCSLSIEQMGLREGRTRRRKGKKEEKRNKEIEI